MPLFFIVLWYSVVKKCHKFKKNIKELFRNISWCRWKSLKRRSEHKNSKNVIGVLETAITILSSEHNGIYDLTKFMLKNVAL